MGGSEPRRGKIEKKRRILKPEALARLLNLPDSKPTVISAKIKQVAIAKMPPPPSNLTPAAKAHWHFMVRQLADRIEALDSTALALYCETYAEWQTAGEELKKKGCGAIMTNKDTGGKYRNPWHDIRKSARREMYMYLALFGMSPHDRVKLGMDTQRHSAVEVNEFDQFK